jgi:hypothetical protein
MNYDDPIPILRGIIAAATEMYPVRAGIGRTDFAVPIRLLMSCADEIARLRDQVDRLNSEVALLRAGGTMSTEGRDEQAEATVPNPSAGARDPGSP